MRTRNNEFILYGNIVQKSIGIPQSWTVVYSWTGQYVPLAGDIPTTYNPHNVIPNGSSQSRENGQTSACSSRMQWKKY